MAHKIQFAYGKAWARLQTGNAYFARGDFYEALNNYVAIEGESVSHTKESRFQLVFEKANMNIANVYVYWGNYPEALKRYMAALRSAEKLDDTLSIASIKMNMGVVYVSQAEMRTGMLYLNKTDYSSALKCFSEALALCKKNNYRGLLINLYQNRGNAYRSQGLYDEALADYFRALQIAKEDNDPLGACSSYINLGNIYALQGKYNKALHVLFVAKKIAGTEGAKRELASISSNTSNVYLHLHEPQKARMLMKNALDLYLGMAAKDGICESYGNMASIDSILGDYKSAFADFKMYLIYKDSIHNEENVRKITQATMQYEFEKTQIADSLRNEGRRKLAAARLEKQKLFTFSGISLATLMLISSGFFFVGNKKLSREKRKSENLLLNILPASVANELKEKGNAEAKLYDHVTVLFTDFVNFTKAGESMTPQELVEELHHCFKAFDEIISEHGIEKIKTIGMLIWRYADCPMHSQTMPETW